MCTRNDTTVFTIEHTPATGTRRKPEMERKSDTDECMTVAGGVGSPYARIVKTAELRSAAPVCAVRFWARKLHYNWSRVSIKDENPESEGNMEILLGLSGVLASVLGLVLAIYAVFVNGPQMRKILFQHGQVMGEIGQMLERQSQTLGQQGQMLEQQSRMLERQSQMLEQQSRILERQSQMLEQQSRMLERQGQVLEHLGRMLERQSQMLEHQGQMLERMQASLERVEDTLRYVAELVKTEGERTRAIIQQGS